MANRKRKVNQSGPQTPQKPEFQFVTAGRYFSLNEDGTTKNELVLRERLNAIKASNIHNAQIKTAALMGDTGLGGADIADSDNIGYNSFEFPVDALEMPASRPEELRFYRLAYDRDPIVARAIDLHTELPCSKMALEKPKSSVESFADFVFDWFQRLVNDTRLFAIVIEATREYNTIGETFLFVEMPPNFDKLTLCPATKKALEKGRGFQAGITPMSEAENAPVVGQEREILNDFVEAKKKKTSAYNLLHKRGSSKAEQEERKKLIHDLLEDGITVDPDEDIFDTLRALNRKRAKLAKKIRFAKIAKRRKIAEPGAPSPDAEPAPNAGDAGNAAAEGGDTEAVPDEGGDPPVDDFGGGAAPSFGGGGGFGGGPSIGADQADSVNEAISLADDAKRTMEISELKRTIMLLEKKKELLEELQDLLEKRKQEQEIFSHVVNEDFEGFERIQMLAPEQVELKNENGEVEVYYKPSPQEKTGYLGDPDVPREVKEALQSNGSLPLNKNPFEGSYVIHFARKKAGYELHGRSILQRVIRQVIYREKLRQVQTTLASRNMTPKTIISAPGVSAVEVQELRALADEAKADPDFTIVVNYAIDWNEISSQGRLLSLSDEYTQLNQTIAVGLGLSPDILLGEGMYGGNRIQLEILNTSYCQYRESLTDLIETQVFKILAMMKGFYEVDNYGRPRWIYPKVTFGRMALRDSSDVMEQLFSLYSKGSLPVSVIYEFLSLDTETIRRQLQDDLFTVADSKFNEGLSSVYSGIGQSLIESTDLVKRIAKNMQLNEEQKGGAEIEGSGEGV